MNTARQWPPGLVATHRTPEFDEVSLPDRLRHAHRTKPGVWGALCILEGRVRFRDDVAGTDVDLGPGSHPVIQPERAHMVTPLGRVRFFVQFYGLPPTSS